MGQLVTVFLLTVALAEAAAGPDLPAQLTLPQALDIALSNSTIIREALARLDQDSGRYQQSRSRLLPQLSISARQNFQTVNLVGIGIDLPSAKGFEGPFGSMDARVLLSQLLSPLSLEPLKAKATRDTLMNQTKLADDLYRLTRDRVTHGVAAELDANRAMQKVNAIEQQSQEAAADFEVTDEAAYGAGTPANPDVAFQAALAPRADYRAAEASVRAAELLVKSARASRIPALAMTFGDGQSGNTPANNVNTYKVQGAIDLPLDTGGRIRGEIEEAEGALREVSEAA